MIGIEEFRALPTDKHLAYAKLEEILREKIGHQPEETLYSQVNYEIAETYRLVLNSFSSENDLGLEIPPFELFDPEGNIDSRAVYSAILASGAAQKTKALSKVTSYEGFESRTTYAGAVFLPEDMKIQVCKHCEKIRKIIYSTELDESVESKLLQSLSNFQRSVEESRTNIARYGQIAVDIASYAEEIAEKMDPIVKILEKIARIFKQNQYQSIEGHGEQKKLPPPEDEQPF